MNRKRIKEILVWILVLSLTLCAMSYWSRLEDRSSWWPDLFMVLGAFLSYYFSDLKATIILVLLGFFKDLLFASVLGPTALVAIVVHWLTSIILDFEENKSWHRGLLFSAVWIFLAQVLQLGLFNVLPGNRLLGSRLGTQFWGVLQVYAKTLVPSLLASLAYLGLFSWLYPDFMPTTQAQDLEIDESPGRLL